jgi:hypothetical protein
MPPVLALLLSLAVPAAPADDEVPPAGFKRYLPRGRILALDDPQFVPAREAQIPPEAWVLGVVVDGQARAYELNLLSRYEVVNDRFGGRPVATVWCPLANSGAVYDRTVKGRELHFEPSGVLMYGSIVMQDRETDSFWPLLQGGASYGSLKGTSLPVLPVSSKRLWKDWVREHPDTLVLSVGGQQALDKNPMEAYLSSSYGFQGLQAADPRLATKEPVFGFELSGKRYAVAARDAQGGRVFPVGTRSVLLYRPPEAALNVDTRAFVSEAGFAREGGAWVEKESGARFDPAAPPAANSGLVPVRGFDTFWYVWSLNHPDTDLLRP